jgi:nitrous oxidase accessory protein NosD
MFNTLIEYVKVTLDYVFCKYSYNAIITTNDMSEVRPTVGSILEHADYFRIKDNDFLNDLISLDLYSNIDIIDNRKIGERVIQVELYECPFKTRIILS